MNNLLLDTGISLDRQAFAAAQHPSQCFVARINKTRVRYITILLGKWHDDGTGRGG